MRQYHELQLAKCQEEMVFGTGEQLLWQQGRAQAHLEMIKVLDRAPVDLQAKQE